jgi:ubiquinone/menaquinone biosynthesis C-methylase UbiE
MSRPSAFVLDRVGQSARSAFKAAWWTGAALALRAVAKPQGAATKTGAFEPTHDPAPAGFVRRAWMEAFVKDAADVAAGLYPPMEDGPADPPGAVRRIVDLLADGRQVEARRRVRGGVEVREEAPPSGAYPVYYRQNFHFQTGGWFTDESAARYETQVETLFAGTAGAMRRRALSLLAKAFRDRDQRGLAILDLACGDGAFLGDLVRAFPRARLLGVDLSEAYLRRARERSGVQALVQASAERLPLSNASLDGLTCVYLFHELPPRVRPRVAAEIARVLKPGGCFALADAIQTADQPAMGRLLEFFPAYFHEPFFADYCVQDLDRLFGDAGLVREDADHAFLTKAVLYRKRA